MRFCSAFFSERCVVGEHRPSSNNTLCRFRVIRRRAARVVCACVFDAGDRFPKCRQVALGITAMKLCRACPASGVQAQR